MRCKHGIVINRRLKLKCRTDCSLEDFKECRRIRSCTYTETGLHCLFCSVGNVNPCVEKHDEFAKTLVDMAFGC